MKYYIVGSVGSGKSTLARKMSEILKIPLYHLDEVVHEVDLETKIGNVKRSDEAIRRIFQDILSQDNFIIEDCLRDRFTAALQEVDKVIFLDIAKRSLYFRVISRWLKQRLRLETASYKANLQMLKNMFIWINESPREKLVNLDNVIVLHNKKESNRFLETLK